MKQQNLYLITPDVIEYTAGYLKQLNNSIGLASLVQFRSKHLAKKDYLAIAKEVIAICSLKNTPVIVNTDIDTFLQLQASGVHLTSSLLFKYQQRPVKKDVLLSVACHNDNQVQQAEKIDADLIVLCPVFKTISSPKGIPLGWNKFAQIAQNTHVPVYALGGLSISDYQTAIAYGAAGLAAKRALWTT